MTKILIKNGLVINRGQSSIKDVLIINDRIEKVDQDITDSEAKVIDAKGKWVIPGIIDDQVHFRQPGLTHKASIYTESRAALAGGVTCFMEMPNTKPTATTITKLEQKYTLAKASSITNYSFFMGATNDNIEEVLKTDASSVCGLKIFMGSSTGNMLVDDMQVLEKIFSNSHMLIATHCEDEATIRKNMKAYESKSDMLDATYHPIIRSREGCYKSSSLAVDLAKKHGARLHILHISTKEELDLFDNSIPLEQKKITAEGCVHHLFFNDQDYNKLGNKIKCNPAIKSEDDRKAIFAAVLDDRIDIIATDHAPHTIEEKSQAYMQAPSGLPLVQHSLTIMLDFYHKGEISKEKIIEKMCHSPAIMFNIIDRGFIEEGMYADLSIVDPEKPVSIAKKDLFYKCQWSPLEGYEFKGEVEQVFVNGVRKFRKGRIINQAPGMRLLFNRN